MAFRLDATRKRFGGVGSGRNAHGFSPLSECRALWRNMRRGLLHVFMTTLLTNADVNNTVATERCLNGEHSWMLESLDDDMVEEYIGAVVEVGDYEQFRVSIAIPSLRSRLGNIQYLVEKLLYRSIMNQQRGIVVDVLREFGPDVNPRMLASAFVFAKKAAIGAWERLDNGGLPDGTPAQVPNGVIIYQKLLDYTRVWFPELFDVASAHATKMLTGDASVPTNAEGFVRHMFILVPNGPPGTKSDVPL